MSHTYRWPYTQKVSRVLLRILAVPTKKAFWSNAMIIMMMMMMIIIIIIITQDPV